MEYTLVIDLVDDEKRHYGSLFLQQAEIQAYWVVALHRNEHGQMTDMEMMDYLEQLRCRGFEEVTRENLNKERPEKYYIHLTRNHDWNIDEILVVNDFHRRRVLKMLVKKLNMSALAHRLLVDDWDTTRHWMKQRGNVQLNHGSNHVNQRDKDRVPGMNVASDHQLPKTLRPGLDGDLTIEDTLIRMQVIVTRIFDEIASIFGKKKAFNSRERREWFSSKLMKDRGLHVDSYRADGGTFLYSGLLPERSNGSPSAKCNFHVDKYNDPREDDGMNATICICQVVPMRFPNRMHPVPGRVALNQYGKRCNGDAVEKYRQTMWLCKEVKQNIERHGLLDELDPNNIDWSSILNNVKAEARKNGDDFAALPAHGNKDCHYSWYVHVILTEIVPIYGWNEYVIIEAVYAMALTPSAVGWRKGVRYALLARTNGFNFYHNFVYELVAKDDAVAKQFKTRARHQVSSGGMITNHEAMASCMNCLMLIDHANDPNVSSDHLYADFASNTFVHRRGRMRGLMGVAILTSHDIVNVLTKLEMITNLDHMRNITIAKNTETARRLAKVGITSDAHLREVVHIIAKKLNIGDYQIVENLICETLRRLEDGGGDRYVGVDTIGIEQPLYRFVQDVLHVVRRGGVMKPANIRLLKNKRKVEDYQPMYKWWRMSVDNPKWELGSDYDLVLTKKSKVLAEYLERKGIKK